MIPKHIAIIMDGNGRWARERGLQRVEGHREGTRIAEDIITKSRDIGIEYLTLYAFSRENWQRPIEEVQSLMALLKNFLISKKQKMIDNQIRFNAIGNLQMLPGDVLDVIDDVKNKTSQGSEMMLTLALSYGSRDEIVRAVQRIVEINNGSTCTKTSSASSSPAPAILVQALSLSKGELDEEGFSKFLDTHNMPDPDLIIRTGGDHRISNFLLWQAAYAELIFEECYWPDFTPNHLMKAIEEYEGRERRFGKISEQLK